MASDAARADSHDFAVDRGTMMLRKGEFTTVKFFVQYRLRDGKVAHLKAATWPADVGVTKPTPRCEDGAGTGP